MIVTDLDGTLLDERSRLSARNRETLERLGRRGVVRVVATGRNLYSALRALGEDFPIDYLVFSSGAGVAAWPSAELLRAHEMAPAEARLAAEVLQELGLDFMLHGPVPQSHRFYYWRTRVENPDFERRLARYAEFAQPWPGELPRDLRASQLVAIEPPGRASRQREVERRLARLAVIRTTSPLDHVSRWLELFPADVGKERAAEWLRARLEVSADDVAAVGNDFNDQGLLDWAKSAFVTGNAPEELRARYCTVAHADRDGFSQAVELWQKPGRPLFGA